MDYKQIKADNRRRAMQFESEMITLPGEWDGSVPFFPRYLQIEHTNRCNARCIMCNHLYTGNRDAMDIDIHVLYALEEILPYAETVMLNGDGEPFLCKNLRQSLALFKKYEVEIGTNTNFSYVPDDVWDYLADGFSFLNISCDVSAKELYEKIRLGLSFDKFLQNLNHLNAKAPNLKKNLDCVLMRQNIAYMEEIVRFAADYKFDSVRFHSLGVNPVIGNEKDYPGLYLHYLAEQIEKAKETAQRLGIEIQVPEIFTGREINAEQREKEFKRIQVEEASADERIHHVMESEGPDLRPYLGEKVTIEDLSPAGFSFGDICRWSLERCYIDLHGNMTTCCYDVMHRYGNLSEQSFEEIWNGKLYKMFRQEMRDGRLPDWCRHCQWIRNPVF